MSISLHSAADCEKSPSLLAAWIGKIIFALVAAVVMGGRIYLLDDSKLQAGSDVVLPFVSPLVAALFALAPLLACFAHTISIDRQKGKLDSLVLSKIKETQYFITIAKASLASKIPRPIPPGPRSTFHQSVGALNPEGMRGRTDAESGILGRPGHFETPNGLRHPCGETA